MLDSTTRTTDLHDGGVSYKQLKGAEAKLYFCKTSRPYQALRSAARKKGLKIGLTYGKMGKPQPRLFRVLRGKKSVGLLHVVHITSLHRNGGGNFCGKTNGFNRARLARRKFLSVLVDATHPETGKPWKKLFVIRTKTFLDENLRFIQIPLEQFHGCSGGPEPAIDWYEYVDFDGVV